MTPAETLLAAGARLCDVMGMAGIVDANIADPLAGLLTAATRLATAYPEMAADHDRTACDDYTCDLMGATLAVAREILGQPDRNQK